MDDDIIAFASAAEFQGRRNYHARLEVTADELDRIIGKYTLPAAKAQWIACGLNRCEEPHRHGYVIRMTDGRETHCGNVCGLMKFGVKFEDVIARAKRTEDATAMRRRIEELVATREQMLTRAKALIAPCVRMELRIELLRGELHKHSSLWKRLVECARHQGAIRVAVEAPPNPGAYHPSRAVQLRTMGRIAGVTLLQYECTRYSHVIEAGVISWLAHDLSDQALQGLNDRQLRDLSKRSSGHVDTMARAERMLSDGAKLFEPANLRQLEVIVEHQLSTRDVTPGLRASLDRAYAL